MKLFNKKRQSNTIEYNEKARIKVLGGCCKKADDSYQNVLKAALKKGYENEVTLVSDNFIIASYGVMQTPALIIDEKVVSYGQLITENDAYELMERFLEESK